MATFDLTPLYRSTVGFDRLASVIDTAYRNETSSAGYPPYDIEVRDENEYAVTIAAAGFEQEELDIQAENRMIKVTSSSCIKVSRHEHSSANLTWPIMSKLLMLNLTTDY